MTRKPTAYILLFVTACALLAGCGRSVSDADRLLARIDSLADVDPDSADVLLKPTPSTSLKGREKEEVALLLRIKVDDKLYRPVTHYRDTILQLVSYFEQHPKVLPSVLGSTGPAMPYLYAGRIFADLGDAPQALDYYQRALDVQPAGQMENGKMKNENEDARRLAKQRGLLHSFIGTIFIYQDMPYEAISEIVLANQNAIMIQDTIDIIFNYRDIAEQYKYLNENDSSLFYYQKALQYANDYGDMRRITELNSQIARYYKDQGKYHLARKYMQPAIDNFDSLNISSTYSILSDIYKNTNKPDSALFLYSKLLQFGNVYAKYNANRGLCELYLKKGDVKSAYAFFSQYKELDDSIKKMDNAETVARMHAAYNYAIHERKAGQLVVSNERKKTALLVTSSIALVCALLLTIFIIIFQKRKKEQSSRILYLQEVRNSLKRSSDEYKVETQIKIEKLEQTIKNLADAAEDERLKKQEEIEKLEAEKERLLLLLKTQETVDLYRKKADETIRNSSIYQTFKALSHSQERLPNNSEWEELSSIVNSYYPDFEIKLRRQKRLSKKQYHVCLLRKLDFSTSEACFLLTSARTTLYSICSRLYEDITGEKGSVTAFDSFLRAL